MTAFNWLHLTDLHLGMTGQKHLWPNIRESFFNDLTFLHNKCGPWDAVLFTGDFVQKGSNDEFEELNKLFDQIWDHLAKLGSEPVLFAVPGNHDLTRPDPKMASVRMLSMWEQFDDVAEEFWNDPKSEYRQVINQAYANYLHWWNNSPLRGDVKFSKGLLPGDFSATWENNGFCIGIVGVNTSFLQLTGGDFKKRLAWDARQFHKVCGDDGAQWAKQHHACLLLSHHPPEWLNSSSEQKVYSEINPAGRFAIHLFGHMHENTVRSSSRGGGEQKRLWQGSSLFGLEFYGDKNKEKRRHGYATGRIELRNKVAYLRHWPRQAVFDKVNGWRFVPDHDSCLLNKDEGTKREKITLLSSAAKINKKKTIPRAIGVKQTRQQQATSRFQEEFLVSYREAALRDCDIIRLSGLPEDDRHLAMQKMLLRQLYVPLRMQVEITAQDRFSEEQVAKIEHQREQQRLSEAGWNLSEKSVQTSSPVGERLAKERRLVVLGEPGGGKTTLLRWISTAYLLRQNKDSAFDTLPDIETLPQEDWLPILVRCRDLDPDKLRNCVLGDIFQLILRKAELPSNPEEIDILVNLLRDGHALLLVDGLDEITDPMLRAAFCEQIENIARVYEKAPMIVTSRIVGYREMHSRIGHGFEHGTLTNLSKEDKDFFVKQWCEVTEQSEQKENAIQELIKAIHSSDRIERLTGNPMLLTTLALVKRKVGKLPNRRHELYREAVSVLLNWRSELDQPLDQMEALPQLEYLAYAMCYRGVQQLRRDELLGLLEKMREQYPNIRPVHQRSPEDFLALVEARTGLLAQVGEKRHNGQLLPVYEFRHLTFQEYLAGLALVEGRFPGHDRSRTLAQRIAPLAGHIEKETENKGITTDLQVAENWREPLKLCVACCNDDEVDDALLAILSPSGDEDLEQSTRPRAILAASCLADELNVSTTVAKKVLNAFTHAIQSGDGKGFVYSAADKAALEISASGWAKELFDYLIQSFLSRKMEIRPNVGGLAAMVASGELPVQKQDVKVWMDEKVQQLTGSLTETVAAALLIMEAALSNKAAMVPNLIENLLHLLDSGDAEAHAAAWALWRLSRSSNLRYLFNDEWDFSFLNDSSYLFSGEYLDELEILINSRRLKTERRHPVWTPDASELAQIISYIGRSGGDPQALKFIVQIFENSPVPEAVKPCIDLLNHDSTPTCVAASRVLGIAKDSRAVEPLLRVFLDSDKDSNARRMASLSLGKIKDPQAVEPLIQVLLDSDEDSNIRRIAASTLGKIEDPQAVEPLIQVLLDSDEDSNSRGIAATALGAVKDSRAVKPLMQVLLDSDEGFNIRSRAATALGAVKDSRAVELLMQVLLDSDEDSNIRSRAATALGAIKDSRAVELLMQVLLDSDEDSNIRGMAASALGTVKDPRVVQSLHACLNNGQSFLRRESLGALLKQRGSETDTMLLSRDLDGYEPFLDPQLPITQKHIEKTAIELKLDHKQITSRLKKLTTDFGIKIEKKQGT